MCQTGICPRCSCVLYSMAFAKERFVVLFFIVLSSTGLLNFTEFDNIAIFLATFALFTFKLDKYPAYVKLGLLCDFEFYNKKFKKFLNKSRIFLSTKFYDNSSFCHNISRNSATKTKFLIDCPTCVDC